MPQTPHNQNCGDNTIGSANQNLHYLPTTSFSTEFSDDLFSSLFKTVEVLFVSDMSLGQDAPTIYDTLKGWWQQNRLLLI